MTNTTTIKGRLAADVDLRHTQQNRPVANFRLAHTPRRYNSQTSAWEDAGETVWLPVTLWGPDAETWAQQAGKGTLATVTGKLQANRYTNREGVERYEVGINADACMAHTTTNSQSPGYSPTQGTASPQNSNQAPYGALAGTQDITDEPPF